MVPQAHIKAVGAAPNRFSSTVSASFIFADAACRSSFTLILTFASSLQRAGIVLPSLRVDPMAYADENPHPLISLGSCNLAMARKLAAVLRETQA